MKENRKGAHPTARLTAHLVWATKYRYHVLQGDIKVRCRQLLMQICDAEDVRIFSGVVSKDHIHCTSNTRLDWLWRIWSNAWKDARRASYSKSILTCGSAIGDDTSGQSAMERGAPAKSRMKLFSNIWSIIEINQTKITIRLCLIRTFSPS